MNKARGQGPRALFAEVKKLKLRRSVSRSAHVEAPDQLGANRLDVGMVHAGGPRWHSRRGHEFSKGLGAVARHPILRLPEHAREPPEIILDATAEEPAIIRRRR